MELKGTKKKPRNLLVLCRVLEHLDPNKSQRQIAKELGISEQLVRYYVSRLIQQGYIKRSLRTSYAENERTPLGRRYLCELKRSSLPTTSHAVRRAQIHHLTMKFPILKDNPSATWAKAIQLRNWVEKSERIVFPMEITVNRTPSHVLACFHGFETDQSGLLTEFFSYVLRGVYLVYSWLKQEKGITVDIFQGEIVDQHIHFNEPEFAGRVDPKMRVTVGLGRPASSIMPMKNKQAKASIDSSPTHGVETNCLTWGEKYLEMPETMHELGKNTVPLLRDLDENLKLHLKVERETGKTMKEIRAMVKSTRKDEIRGTGISLA